MNNLLTKCNWYLGLSIYVIKVFNKKNILKSIKLLLLENFRWWHINKFYFALLLSQIVFAIAYQQPKIIIIPIINILMSYLDSSGGSDRLICRSCQYIFDPPS